MKKLITIISLLLITQACSHTPPKEIPTEIVKFVESSGKVEIEVKGKEWQKIKVKGSAATPAKNKVALEQAMNIATLRAKANLVEFLEDDIKSTKATNTFTKSLIKEGETPENASEITTGVTEEIISSSKGIIKGAYVTDRSVSSGQDYVSVTITVDRKTVDVSKAISKSFK